MDDFKYYVTIDDDSKENLDKIYERLQAENVVPNIVRRETITYPDAGKSGQLFLSTEYVSPEGAVPEWDPKDHEALLHQLSMEFLGATFTLQAFNLDSPNDSSFIKSFHNGLSKEAYYENQDLSDILASKPWHEFGNENHIPHQERVSKLLSKLESLSEDPAFSIAKDMFYIKEKIVLTTNPLKDSEIYALACKIADAVFQFDQPMVHEEYMDGLRRLLEEGLPPFNAHDLTPLNPQDTLQLLLKADRDTFIYLVEMQGIVNRSTYECATIGDYTESASEQKKQCEKLIERFKMKPELDARISDAKKRGAAQPSSGSHAKQEPQL